MSFFMASSLASACDFLGRGYKASSPPTQGCAGRARQKPCPQRAKARKVCPQKRSWALFVQLVTPKGDGADRHSRRSAPEATEREEAKQRAALRPLLALKPYLL